jgi:hypothetical protein
MFLASGCAGGSGKKNVFLWAVKSRAAGLLSITPAKKAVAVSRKNNALTARKR